MSALMPVIPVSGSPGGVAEQARALQDLADRLQAVDDLLLDLRTMARWESPSGERFAAALAELPLVLKLLIERYRGAADALLAWVVELRSAIRVTERAAEQHLSARIELDDIERDLQTASADPTSPRFAELTARRARATARAEEAAAEASRAWLRLHEAAGDCAGRLNRAATDSLLDSADFTFIRTARSVTSGVTAALGVAAVVPSPVQPFAAAGAGAGTAALVGFDLLLLLGYGDGTLWDVTTSVAWSAAGRAAGPLGKAAGAGAVKGVNGAWAGRRMTTPDRLRVARTELRKDLAEQRAALRTPIADRSGYAPALAGSRPPAIGPRQQAHIRTLRAIEDRLTTKVLGINDRWQMALANGGNAVVLQGSSDVLRVATTARTAGEVLNRGVDGAVQVRDRRRDHEERRDHRRGKPRN